MQNELQTYNWHPCEDLKVFYKLFIAITDNEMLLIGYSFVNFFNYGLKPGFRIEVKTCIMRQQNSELHVEQILICCEFEESVKVYTIFLKAC